MSATLAGAVCYAGAIEIEFPTPSELHEPLLAFLQDAVGSCSYVEPPTPMTPGNDTQVHALRLDSIDHPLVLRVFQRGSDPQRPVFEATLNDALADQGLPVPRAVAVCPDASVIGAPFFLMERSPGFPLFGDVVGTDERGIPTADWRRVLRQGREIFLEMPGLLAEISLLIHAIDPKPVIEALSAADLPWEEITVDGQLTRFVNRVEEFGLDGLRHAGEWLQANRPAEESPLVVCHCDVQPLNILAEGRDVRGIIDWANAALAPPELELGWTRAMFLTIELPLPGPLRLLEGPMGRYLANGVMRGYERTRPVDHVSVAYYETLRSLIGLSILGEQTVTQASIRDAWNSRKAIDRTIALVRERAGIEVSISWAE